MPPPHVDCDWLERLAETFRNVSIASTLKALLSLFLFSLHSLHCVVLFLQVLLRRGEARVTAVTRGPAPIPPPGWAIPPGPALSIEGVMVSTGERIAVDAKEILLVREGGVEGSGRGGSSGHRAWP